MFEIERNEKHGESYGAAVARSVRAIQESMISHHFGQRILDSLFEIYGRMVDEELAKEEIKPISFVIVLRKVWIEGGGHVSMGWTCVNIAACVLKASL